MAHGKYVAYYRVSTDQQGKSGLGLEAQREIVSRYLNGGAWESVGEFTEIETGKRADRPQLARALARCRQQHATLIVAKLDRLSRNTRFLLQVVHDSGEAGVVFCDLPTIPEGPVGKFIVTQMASVAELEAGLISQRTKAALKAAKARGTKLGGRRVSAARFAEIGAAARQAHVERVRRARVEIMPAIEKLQASGARSLRQFAAGLNAAEVPTPRGRGEWSAVQAQRLLKDVTFRKLFVGAASLAEAAVA
ncbi:MAG: recombinase family protein [Terracidiphilus sp.]|nr:recombinase family protein [Terracidiphilus sp.]